jgi:hypothetical protein
MHGPYLQTADSHHACRGDASHTSLVARNAFERLLSLATHP